MADQGAGPKPDRTGVKSGGGRVQAPDKKAGPRRALVLAGGAPNATFMSGALAQFLERGIGFDVIDGSGAGAVVALLYAAPAGADRRAAMEQTVNEGVSDALYNLFPVNYKVFQKHGPLADTFRTWSEAMFGRTLSSWNGSKDRTRQFMADAMQFMMASATPWPLDLWSSGGLCQILPGFESQVDFARLRRIDETVIVNAYDVEARAIRYFKNPEITAQHARAALSFPYLYPAQRIDGRTYLEGASFDDVPYEALLNNAGHLDEIYLIDVLGTNNLIRRPGNLEEAFTLMIVASITAAAQMKIKLFLNEHLFHRAVHQCGQAHAWTGFEMPRRAGNFGYLEREPPRVYFVDASEAALSADALTWKRSNLEAMFRSGYDAAGQAIDRPVPIGHRERAPKAAGSPSGAKPARPRR